MPANERRIMLQNIIHIRCGLAAGELAREAACFIAHKFCRWRRSSAEEEPDIIHFNAVVDFFIYFSFLSFVLFWFGLFCVEQRNQCKGLRLTAPSTSPRTLTTLFPAKKIRFVGHTAWARIKTGDADTQGPGGGCRGAGRPCTHPCSGPVAATLTRTRRVYVFSSFQDLFLFEIRPIHFCTGLVSSGSSLEPILYISCTFLTRTPTISYHIS
jgi:hypothetical protein